jgi:hypothetical protein
MLVATIICRNTVMNNHFQRERAEPYSPLACILLLLLFGVATQFELPAISF